MTVKKTKILICSDWGNGIKTVYYWRNPNTNELERYPFEGSLLEFVKSHHDIFLGLESTFESFVHMIRNEVIEIAKKNGIEIVTTRSSWTSGYRSRKGIEKSDINDSMVIYLIVEEKMAKGHHLKKPTKYEVRESTWKTEFELLRRTGYPKEKVLAALSVLPDPSTLPDYVKETLTEDGKYSHTIVLPMIFWAVDIVSRNSNRREFLDSFAHGYAHPGLIRSTYTRRIGVLERRILKAVEGADKTKDEDGVYRSFVRRNEEIWLPVHKQTMQKTTKALKYLFWQVKENFARTRVTPNRTILTPAKELVTI